MSAWLPHKYWPLLSLSLIKPRSIKTLSELHRQFSVLSSVSPSLIFRPLLDSLKSDKDRDVRDSTDEAVAQL